MPVPGPSPWVTSMTMARSGFKRKVADFAPTEPISSCVVETKYVSAGTFRRESSSAATSIAATLARSSMVLPAMQPLARRREGASMTTMSPTRTRWRTSSAL